MQRQQLGWRERPSSSGDGSTVGGRVGARSWRGYPDAGRGRRQHPVRPQRRLRRPCRARSPTVTSWRSSRPWRAGRPRPIGASSCGPSRSRTSSGGAAAGGRVDRRRRRGARSWARPARAPGTPAPGQEAVAAGLAGQAGRGARVRGVRDRWRWRCWAPSRTRSRRASGWRRARHPAPHRRGAAGRCERAHRGRRGASRRRLRRLPLRHRGAQGACAHLEAGAFADGRRWEPRSGLGAVGARHAACSVAPPP